MVKYQTNISEIQPEDFGGLNKLNEKIKSRLVREILEKNAQGSLDQICDILELSPEYRFFVEAAMQGLIKQRKYTKKIVEGKFSDEQVAVYKKLGKSK